MSAQPEQPRTTTSTESEDNMATVATIIAIILGPILAVQADRWLQAMRERKQRKQKIFETLMSTRGDLGSVEHVRALNLIDLAFRQTTPRMRESQADKAVLDAWHAYRSHLHKPYDKAKESESKAWSDNVTKLLITLLSAMAKNLGYDFEHDQFEKGTYKPDVHIVLQHIQRNTLVSLASVLSGRQPLHVRIMPDDGQKIVPALGAPGEVENEKGRSEERPT